MTANAEVKANRGLARVEDAALLTGRGQFLDDLDPLPGTLVASIVRSPHPHAHIKSIDFTDAMNMTGVITVIGSDEISATLKPFPLSLGAPTPYYPTAINKVRYVGEPVAVVVATDRYTAEDAAELVKVEYEILDHVVDTDQASIDGAPLLHEDAGTNVVSDRSFNFGSTDEAFKAASKVITGEYDFPRYSSTPMECYSVIAHWTSDISGPEVVAYSNFHGPFTMVPVLSGALGISPSKLRLIVPKDIGGSFGIKAGIYPYIALMAVASKYSGKPVRWTEDRTEHLLSSSAGSDRKMSFKAAVDESGKVTALDIDFRENVGAYIRPPEPATLYRCFGNITGAYKIPAVRLRSRAVVTNKLPTGLNRGFGGQQLYFGLERTMDKIARELDIDPLQLRKLNLIEDTSFPYETPTGGIYDSGQFEKALDLLEKSSDYSKLREIHAKARKEGKLCGVGVAAIVEPSATNIGYVGLATPSELRRKGRDKSGSTEHVRITVDPFGTVTVLLGTVPQGQGHATVARQIVANQLGLPPEKVIPKVEMDTDSTPWTVTTGSYSSRFSPLLSSALVDASEKLAESIKKAAAVLLHEDISDLRLENGAIVSANSSEKSVPFKAAAGLLHWDPGALPDDVSAEIYVNSAFTPPESKAPSQDDKVNSSLCYGFAAEVVAVSIDPDTFEISIDDVFAVHDAGTVLNQALIEGQIHGAMVHGLGGAMYEEMRYSDSGQPTSTFMDYLVPSSAESYFPHHSERIVTPSPVTRLGAKGSGEGSSMSFPVAIANAISDALSEKHIDIDKLPIHPGAIHELLMNKK